MELLVSFHSRICQLQTRQNGLENMRDGNLDYSCLSLIHKAQAYEYDHKQTRLLTTQETAKNRPASVPQN